jgi:hypothetical protein
VTVRWFSPGTFVSSTNKTDRLDITEILLKCGSCVIVVINEKQKYNIIRTLVGILLICGQHFDDFIFSLIGDVRAHRTNLTQQFLIAVHVPRHTYT